jgi:hypothetical protein
MSEPLREYLDNTWALLDNELSNLNKKNKIQIIERAFKKLSLLKALPVDSEDIAKLAIGILLAEALEGNIEISETNQKIVFQIMMNELNKKTNHHPSRMLNLIKITLGLAAGAAALWFTGPYCAIVARYLFAKGYIALYGQPGWMTHYSYFLPAQEWVGNLAFTYGPKLLSVPTGFMSAQAVDFAIQALNQAQKIVTFSYRSALYRPISKISINEKIDLSSKADLGCFI